MRRGRFKQTVLDDGVAGVGVAPHGRLSGSRFLASDPVPDDARPLRARLISLKVRLRILKRLAHGGVRHRGASVIAERTEMRSQAPEAANVLIDRTGTPIRSSRTPSTSLAAPGRSCGARCKQTGYPCLRRPSRDLRTGQVRNGRCHLHGGLSTGPRTSEGRARAREAVRRRWDRYHGGANGLPR